MGEPAELRFLVLGPLEVFIGGRAVALGGSKPRTLLAALLAVPNRVVSTDRLVEIMWGDRPPERSHTTLQKYVHGLRSAIDPGRRSAGDRVLLSRPPGYVLAVDADQIDAARFERLVADGQRRADRLELNGAKACFDEALALWRGPAWTEFTDEEFARVEAARLESLRALAAESRVDVGLAAGEHAQLLAGLEATVAAYPLRDRPRAQLMIALYRCGRQADALRAFQDFRRFLAEEVGLEPSAAIQELDAAIATRSTALDLAPAGRPSDGDDLPSGTVTFLFTDIEGSTRLWESAPEAMRKALGRHDEILRWIVEAHGGYVFATGGDGLAAAFHRAGDGLEAAIRAQQQLSAEPWPEVAPVRVRMGLHSGEVDERRGDYFGPAVNRAARIMAAGHGGQILVSATSASLVREALPSRATLVDLGTHRLRDLSEPETLFQVGHPGLSSMFPPLRAVAAGSNLPTQRSSFVGRVKELGRLAVLLTERHIVTLVGVGGVGKTRLALQAAGELSGRFPGGVWLVELARTGEPTAVIPVARAALGLNLTPGRSDLASLCDFFGPTEALMVLDNCEHVLDAAADLVAEMVERCARVRVLCTSREPLNLAGEQVLPVRPLDPSGDALVLLDDRVREVAPDLDVLGVEQTAALEICRRLDGVPHALELAAARAATMTLDEIARGLDDRFRLLAFGRRRSVERHQTLRASLDWSHQLLSEPAQRLFRRLAVFAGGFGADAAQAVGVQSGENLEVGELLASLVRSSIALHDRTPFGTRFRLLETIRSYAEDRLQEAGEATSVSRAHAEWMVSLVGHRFEEWCTAGSGLYQRFEAERDNWREAVGFALASQDSRLAVALLTNMGCIETEEAVPLAAEALKLPGVEAVPGYHWLHRTIAMRGGMLLNADLLSHVDEFDAKCTSPQERAYLAHSHATRGVVTGTGPDLGAIAQALAIPGLSPQLVAFLKLHQSMWTNWPEPIDIEIARQAVDAARKANTIYVPLAEAFLAGALRKDHPDEALALAQKIVETDLDELNSFARAGIHASTSTIVTEVPVRAGAIYLRDRLAGLQASVTGVEMTYFAVCANVLARANHPAAAPIRSFVVSRGHGHTFASLLPDLADSSAPTDMDRLIDTVRIALDEVISGTIQHV